MLLNYRSYDDPTATSDEKPSYEITREIVNRHLSDINDKISEDDIRKINTDTKPDPSAEKKKHSGHDEISDQNNDGKVSSPWNIID